METRRLELLQKMPVFGAIRDDSLRLLLAQARVLEVGAGHYFFREGDAATTMFVLEAGQAVVVKGWRGREVILNQLAVGDCFGEMALMDLGWLYTNVFPCLQSPALPGHNHLYHLQNGA